jgi:hypothetical protein
MWKGQPYNTKAKRAKYNLQKDIPNLKYFIFKGSSLVIEFYFSTILSIFKHSHVGK